MKRAHYEEIEQKRVAQANLMQSFCHFVDWYKPHALDTLCDMHASIFPAVDEGPLRLDVENRETIDKNAGREQEQKRCKILTAYSEWGTNPVSVASRTINWRVLLVTADETVMFSACGTDTLGYFYHPVTGVKEAWAPTLNNWPFTYGIDRLPRDSSILLRIFRKLRPESWLICTRVCKEWNHVVTDPSLWTKVKEWRYCADSPWSHLAPWTTFAQHQKIVIDANRSTGGHRLVTWPSDERYTEWCRNVVLKQKAVAEWEAEWEEVEEPYVAIWPFKRARELFNDYWSNIKY